MGIYVVPDSIFLFHSTYRNYHGCDPSLLENLNFYYPNFKFIIECFDYLM